MSQGVADKLAVAEEYVAKYSVGVTAKKEFSNHVTYATDKERMMALKSTCLTKKILRK